MLVVAIVERLYIAPDPAAALATASSPPGWNIRVIPVGARISGQSSVWPSTVRRMSIERTSLR